MRERKEAQITKSMRIDGGEQESDRIIGVCRLCEEAAIKYLTWCQAHALNPKSPQIKLLLPKAHPYVVLSTGKWVINYIREVGLCPSASFLQRSIKATLPSMPWLWEPQTQLPCKGRLF